MKMAPPAESPLSPFHEIVELSWDDKARKGQLRALRHNRMDDWFYGCHFVGDPVMPGCWGVDAIWEGLRLFASRLDLANCDKPLTMEDVRFFGQIRPYDRTIAYTIDVLGLERSGGDCLLTARADVCVDGKAVYSIGTAQAATAYWERPAATPPPQPAAAVLQPLSRPLAFSEFVRRERFSPAEIIAISLGRLVADPPGEMGLLPAPPMLQIGQVDSIAFDHASGEGRILASLANSPRDWFYPMSPGGKPAVLSIDGIWQLMGLFLAWQGHAGTGRALGFERVEVFDAIMPADRHVAYDVRVVKASPAASGDDAFVRADADVFADGRLILRCTNASVGCHLGIRYSDYPFVSKLAGGPVV